MANQLINGTEGAMAPSSTPEVDPNAGKVATFGYDAATGEARLFHLEPGAALPKGFVDSPAKAKPAAPSAAKKGD